MPPPQNAWPAQKGRKGSVRGVKPTSPGRWKLKQLYMRALPRKTVPRKKMRTNSTSGARPGLTTRQRRETIKESRSALHRSQWEPRQPMYQEIPLTELPSAEGMPFRSLHEGSLSHLEGRRSGRLDNSWIAMFGQQPRRKWSILICGLQ